MKYLRKNIDIPESDGTLKKLKLKAVKQGKDLKNYIQDILIELSKK